MNEKKQEIFMMHTTALNEAITRFETYQKTTATLTYTAKIHIISLCWKDKHIEERKKFLETAANIIKTFNQGTLTQALAQLYIAELDDNKIGTISDGGRDECYSCLLNLRIRLNNYLDYLSDEKPVVKNSTTTTQRVTHHPFYQATPSAPPLSVFSESEKQKNTQSNLYPSSFG